MTTANLNKAHAAPRHWLLWLLLATAPVAQAESVYKCIGADGGLAYQATPCAVRQRQQEIELQPAPARVTPASVRVGPAPKPPRSPRAASRSRALADKPVLSYECRVADGALFYQHGPCPKSVPSDNVVPGGKGRGQARAKPLAVAARALPRAEACKRINASGVIGRRGHERDERVSAYERSLGRDPCRRY